MLTNSRRRPTPARTVRARVANLACWPLLLVVITGCGGERRAVPDSPGAGPIANSGPAPDGLRALTVYWGDANAERVVPVTRYVNPDSGLARGAVLALLAGPNTSEAARGLSSNVPAETRLRGLVVRDSTATVDLSRAFESGGGTSSMGMRLAQLVYTLTRVPGVSRVRLWLDGQPVSTFSGEGLTIDGPLTPADFADLAPFDLDPPVVLLEPVPGSVVGDSVRVRGTANVFEAHVGLRVRDAGGRVVLETWTTASCGTGCRGSFEKSLALPDTLSGAISIEAFAPSPKDGSDMHLVTSPVSRIRVRPGAPPAA